MRCDGSELVRHHERTGVWPEDPHTVNGAAANEQTRERQVAVGRRPEASTSRLERHRVRTLRERISSGRPLERRQPPGFVEAGQRCPAMSLVARHDEVRVVHTERIEHALPHDRTERRLLDPRQEETEHVRGDAVVKGRSRLIDERQCREPADPLVGSQHVVDLRSQGLRTRRAYWTAMKLAVRQSGPMREQVAERDRARGRDRLVERTSGSRRTRKRSSSGATRVIGLSRSNRPSSSNVTRRRS